MADIQFLLIGLVYSGIILLGALGVSLIYGVKRFANFAHGDLMTLGAYMALFGVGLFGGNMLVGVLFSFVVLAFVGIVLEVLIFGRLENRGPIAPLIASVGVSLVLQNVVNLVFSTQIKNYPVPLVDNWYFGPFFLNPIRGLIPLVAGYGAALALLLLLRFTKLGKAMRAAADNLDLARTSGVNTRAVYFSTWALASVLAAAGGVMLGLNTDLTPTMGFTVLLVLFAAVILGGIGSVAGSAVGALVIGITYALFYPFAIQFNVSTQWFLAVPFGLMVLMLIFRPWGLLGKPVGRETRSVLTDLRETFHMVFGRRD